MTQAPTRANRRVDWIWLVFPAAWFWRVVFWPGDVWAWPGGQFSDLLITHLPNATFVHRALAAWHQLPLWNPTILSGMPLVGDPLAGLWYPPLWLAVVWPSAAAFNLLIWLHLAWAGWGMARLARSEGLSTWPAVAAGIVFSGSPKLIGQAALGHETLVMAVAWTPWWLLALSSLAKQPAKTLQRRVWQGVRTGTVLGIIFLADPRWLIASAGLGAAWMLRIWIAEAWGWRDVLGQRLVGWVSGVGQAALVGAVLALPMWQLVSLSTRHSLAASDSAALSLPPSRLLGLLLPDLGGWPEWLTYLGLTALALALAAVLLGGKDWRFWSLLTITGWIMALGDHSPVYPLLVKLVPGLAWQRVPARFLFLSITGGAMLAGIGLDAWLRLERPTTSRRWFNRAAFGWTVLFAVVGVAGALGPATSGADTLRWSMVLAGLAGVASGAALLLQTQLRRRTWLPGALWVGLLMLELGVVDGSLATPRSLPTDSGLPPLVHDGSAGLDGGERIFSPSYSVPQNVAAGQGIQLADGVNPLQLETYWSYMAGALGFDAGQYSVTLPPFPNGDPSEPRSWSVDAQRLGWLNVQTVVSSYPLSSPGLELEGQQSGRYFYFNQDEAPRAWVQQGSGLELAATGSQADVIAWQPNRIEIKAKGPGRLVLSEVAYPGWAATVDGTRQPLEAAGGLLRSLVLEPGQHDIRMAFLPAPALWGATLSLMGFVLAVLAWRRA